VYVPVSRLEEGDLLTVFELIALGTANIATLEATLAYLTKGVATPLQATPAPESGKGIEMLLEYIEVT